jgi:hypothetical protein
LIEAVKLHFEMLRLVVLIEKLLSVHMPGTVARQVDWRIHKWGKQPYLGADLFPLSSPPSMDLPTAA